MTSLSLPELSPAPAGGRAHPLWLVARVVALLALVALLASAVLDPALMLRLVWGVIIPVLPATFLISPALWRGVCPLATFNEFGNRARLAGVPSPRMAGALGLGGMGLFVLLVPARHLVFNVNAPVLAVTALAVGVIAMALGAAFSVRAGFCNGICPVLPVERIYGQTPLVAMGRGRCDRCSVCTPRGCLDLAGDKALAQTLGPARHTNAWLFSPLGVFAAALPGFIAGYNTLTDDPAPSIAAAYAVPLAWAAASFAIVAIAVRVFRVTAPVAFVLLAAAGVSLHYWFAGPVLAMAFALSESAATSFRLAAFLLILAWTVQALRRPAGLVNGNEASARG